MSGRLDEKSGELKNTRANNRLENCLFTVTPLVKFVVRASGGTPAPGHRKL
jgi:hypothetical protein